ncbi:MAG TPA: cytochrome c [Flavisolibacter sp.]|jgi:mono/diheme cytochrome c family protein|nr:cytochrome c [Flavisolibacter sp.]
MKKFIALFAFTITILLVALIPSCVVRKAEPLTQRTFVPKNERVANGERVFMANCEKCHPGGEGGLGPAINSNPAPQFVKRFQMRHGLGVMPSFKRIEISKKDLHDISRFLHAWKSY